MTIQNGVVEGLSPFAIAVAANLGVDDVESRATCEIFEILRSK